MSISLKCLNTQNCAGLGNSTLQDQLAHAHTLKLKLEFQVLPLLLGNMICFPRCEILIRFFWLLYFLTEFLHSFKGGSRSCRLFLNSSSQCCSFPFLFSQLLHTYILSEAQGKTRT